jgi:excisionase family DNA binding protein
MVDTDFLNCQEAAQRLGCTRQHVSRLVRRGQLIGQKIGRDWIISRDSIKRYAARRENFALSLSPGDRGSRTRRKSGGRV